MRMTDLDAELEKAKSETSRLQGRRDALLPDIKEAGVVIRDKDDDDAIESAIERRLKVLNAEAEEAKAAFRKELKRFKQEHPELAEKLTEGNE